MMKYFFSLILLAICTSCQSNSSNQVDKEYIYFVNCPSEIAAFQEGNDEFSVYNLIANLTSSIRLEIREYTQGKVNKISSFGMPSTIKPMSIYITTRNVQEKNSCFSVLNISWLGIPDDSRSTEPLNLNYSNHRLVTVQGRVKHEKTLNDSVVMMAFILDKSNNNEILPDKILRDSILRTDLDPAITSDSNAVLLQVVLLPN